MKRHAETLRANLEKSIQAKQALLTNAAQTTAFEQVAALLVKVYQQGGRLYIGGNGGSAADSQHLAAEFVAKLARPRAPLPAEALTTDTSTLTAIGNDFGFDELFARQIAGKARIDDAFLGITTSGKSRNILRAFETCREKGIPSILLGGKDGGPAKELADYSILAPGEDTSTIQEVQMVLYHSLCECVESHLFPML